ncbi:MAG: hypothetical protein BM555_03630 [Crocinitomix sp. MedPE-SWsnd]|nr:MAG: hypothetical protein BM555_03630 [Crocinitomix sp. MedPE-SWsnd]
MDAKLVISCFMVETRSVGLRRLVRSAYTIARAIAKPFRAFIIWLSQSDSLFDFRLDKCFGVREWKIWRMLRTNLHAHSQNNLGFICHFENEKRKVCFGKL